MVSIIVNIDNFKVKYLNMKDKEKNYTLEDTKIVIFESARKVMKKYFRQVVYTTFSDGIIFLIKPLCEDNNKFFKDLKKICEEIRVKILNENRFTVTIGVGNYESSVMNVHKSFKNAKRAVKCDEFHHIFVLFGKVFMYIRLLLQRKYNCNCKKRSNVRMKFYSKGKFGIIKENIL